MYIKLVYLQIHEMFMFPVLIYYKCIESETPDENVFQRVMFHAW